MAQQTQQPAVEPEGFFKAMDHRVDILAENWNDARQPAVGQHHDEAMDHTRATASQFLEAAQPAEVDLGIFPRLSVDLAR